MSSTVKTREKRYDVIPSLGLKGEEDVVEERDGKVIPVRGNIYG